MLAVERRRNRRTRRAANCSLQGSRSEERRRGPSEPAFVDTNNAAERAASPPKGIEAGAIGVPPHADRGRAALRGLAAVDDPGPRPGGIAPTTPRAHGPRFCRARGRAISPRGEHREATRDLRADADAYRVAAVAGPHRTCDRGAAVPYLNRPKCRVRTRRAGRRSGPSSGDHVRRGKLCQLA